MKTVEEIYAAMTEEFYKRTGGEVEVSGELAARLYAVASQVCALEAQGEWTLRQCFPQTADGVHLDQHAALRALERRGATAATGTLRFHRAGNANLQVTIKKGTVCVTAAQLRVETTADGTLAAGELTRDIPARAVELGEAGNVEARAVVSPVVAQTGVARCENLAAFSGGTEEESDQTLRERILDTYKRLPNGANVAFYQQAVNSMPEIGASLVLPRNSGLGTVDVIITSKTGLPTAAMISKLYTHLQAVREVAVNVKVMSPTSLAVPVSVAVKPAAGFTFAQTKAATEAALRGWFNGTRLGKAVLRGEMGRVVLNEEAVANYTLTQPAYDVQVNIGQLPQLGTLTVTQMG